MLRRYELYNRVVLKFDDFTADTLRDIDDDMLTDLVSKLNYDYRREIL